MKRIFLAVLILFGIWSVSFVGTSVNATEQDECDELFDYTKSSDFNDFRLEIDFENSDQQIDVSAKSGYQITEVALEVPDDGFPGFHIYATGPVNNFNPPGSQDINVTKVKVKKVCATPTPTPTPTPSPTPVDECDQDECEEEESPTPTATPSIEPTPTTPSCGQDEHLNAAGNKCVRWELGGAPTPPPAGTPFPGFPGEDGQAGVRK